ncbi:FlgO family outer membrane protein [Pseudoalteromonas sp. SSDWG2]|uniref:FlgO family outer membrane protein n=1 Tax=Pseudoalteromonas sp. SSDWG2 TaxID=3139391 RepID=UPI003BA8CE57
MHRLICSLLALGMASTADAGSSVAQANTVDINPTHIDVSTKAHKAHHKQLGDYTQQLALALSDGISSQYVSHIAITSFVDFDHTLQNTNALGNQIAQELMADMQRFGYATVDHKLMPNIQVLQSGDFVLTRDDAALSKQVGIDHVLTGTMVYRPNGVLIHARIVATRDKVVKATARQFIPYFVINELMAKS